MSANDLETLLIRSQILTPPQVATAKREAAGRHRRLAAVIVELGLINERRFAEWMSQMTSIAVVEQIPVAAVEPLVPRVPNAIAREYEVVPIKIDAITLTIATMNPLDAGCIEALHMTTGLNIRTMIGLHSAIRDLLDRFYPSDRADDSIGEATRSVPGTKKLPSQLDRIEFSLDELRTTLSRLQERIDAIEESLEHILSRR